MRQKRTPNICKTIRSNLSILPECLPYCTNKISQIKISMIGCLNKFIPLENLTNINKKCIIFPCISCETNCF